MAPGAFNFGDNRYAPLATSPHKKKKRKALSEFPSLPIPTLAPPNPKFIIVSATDEKKPLSHFSCFAVEKSLHIISKEIISVSELRDGNLLLLVNSKTAAEKFIAAKQLAGLCEINCKYHENLNFIKGTIYAPFLIHVPDEEIVKNLESQGVVAVYKFKKLVENKQKESGVILLTFDLYKLPETLKVSWHKLRVREYIPNPMRCKSCQILGHTAKNCKNNCSLPPHGNDSCIRIKCVNCAEEHPSNSNKCTKYIQQKEIIKIKTQQKCSLKQAKSIYISQLPQKSPTSSYAGTAARATSTPIQDPTKYTTANSLKPTSSNLVNVGPSTPLSTSKATIATVTTITTTQPTLPKTIDILSSRTIPNTANQTTSSISYAPIANNTTLPSFSNYQSPITNLTKNLIKNNEYYTKIMEASDSD